MGAITLTLQEQKRLLVLNALQRGDCTPADAARVLGLSARQVRRVRAAYRTRGAAALVHGNRGRPSPRRTPKTVREHLVTLARTTYVGLNHVHFTDLLGEQEGVRLSRPTVHRILTAAGLRSPRTRRPPRHRTRRERMPHAGMLVQFDGSHHAWLEDRGPRLVLHAAVDDATSEILAAWFDDAETAAGYFHVFRQIVLGPGIPLAAYTDRHGIFYRAARAPWTLAEQLRGTRAPTQVGRLLQELGIQWVPASSPQAKGRIERVFGALQDRLVAELRLAGICEKEAANAFLPAFLRRYNARFAHPAAQPDPMYRPWPSSLDPDALFCFKYLRTVANDHTVALGPRVVQILPNGRSYAKARVELHERLDGSLAVVYQGRPVASRSLPPSSPAPAIRARRQPRVHPGVPPRRDIRQAPKRTRDVPARPRRLATPAADHPWRQYEQVRNLNALRKSGRTKSLST